MSNPWRDGTRLPNPRQPRPSEPVVMRRARCGWRLVRFEAFRAVVVAAVVGVVVWYVARR